MVSNYVGHAGEDEKSTQLADLLRRRGFPDARFGRIFKIHDSVTGKPTTSKPDVVFTDGGTNVVSAKDGESLERKAVSSAFKYLRDLGPATKLGEVFAVTYPKQGEEYHLHVLPSGEREEISLVFDKLEEVADAITEVVKGRIAQLAAMQEPTQIEAGRMLRYTAYELADFLSGVPARQLEVVFGGHSFFHSVFGKKLKAKERREALRLGTAFLFINQVLFYALLSQSAQKVGTPDKYPAIEALDKSDPKILQEKYFSRVKARDYEPIYGPNVASLFKAARIGVPLGELVDAIAVLVSKLQVPDLVGQVFQNLIPFGIRKPLGAHYTNPNAAALLAKVAVSSAKDTVLDPACGSGTLLVAAYREKARLSEKHELATLHKQFVEHDITGVDAMAFSSHLAAVNLALQQPLAETDYVRVGTEDSTRLHPGSAILPTSELWPEEYVQTKIYDSFKSQPSRKTKVQRIPALTKHEPRPIPLDPVDIVIMNPPFTSQNNLSTEYKNALKRRFSIPAAHKEVVFWKTSQQVYFMLLADRFLKSKGNAAVVLPFTTFTGRAFHPLVRFLVESYTIRFIVVGLGQASFSEDTSLMECLLVASKAKPSPDASFNLIGTKLPPNQWTSETIDSLVTAAKTSPVSLENSVFIAKSLSQTDLLPDREALSLLYLRLNHQFDSAWRELQQVFSQSEVTLRKVREWFKSGLEITEVYHGDDRPLRRGPKAILMCGDARRALKKIDRLVLSAEDDSNCIFADRFNDSAKFTFPKSELVMAIRHFAYYDSMDITKRTDFCAGKIGKATEKTMAAFYKKEDRDRFLLHLKSKEWKKIIENGSARTNICARADLASPGTTQIVLHSDQACFLVGYGYNVRGFKNEQEEKFFTLWMNSTLGLIQLIAKSTITRGSWIKLEQFTTEQVVMPDVSKLTPEHWISVNELWERVSRTDMPSLLEQLENGDSTRLDLDMTLLGFMGVHDGQEKLLAELLERGLLEAIRMLLATMGPKKQPSTKKRVA